MAEYKHGDMDVEEHERTFEGFIKFVTYVAIGVIVLLLFLALVNG